MLATPSLLSRAALAPVLAHRFVLWRVFSDVYSPRGQDLVVSPQAVCAESDLLRTGSWKCFLRETSGGFSYRFLTVESWIRLGLGGTSICNDSLPKLPNDSDFQRTNRTRNQSSARA